MNAQQLKNSLLQQAIEGKLVEQRPEEGTADDLLRDIKAEKARLIDEGKLKKEKPLPEIKAEEIPFEIPESWAWVRIGVVFNLQAGKNIMSSAIYESQDEPHPFPCFGGNGLRGYVSTYNREGYYPLIGRQGALCGNINFAANKFYATEHAVVVETYCDTFVKWAGIFLEALNLNRYSTATAQPGLAVKTINQVLVPLPPLAEQRRIVAKIEELLPFVEQYGQAHDALTALDAKFPEAMKKSV
ncbi:MAG: restriction endonuclease subunit S, partial [Schwartzia sp.]|nr:restriction endonuclease subunit S [Schwartzia sp. (in: firmicutes)]